MSTNKIDTLEKFNALVQRVTETLGRAPNWSKATSMFEQAGGAPNEENFWMWREFIKFLTDTRLSQVFVRYQPAVFGMEDWVKPEHFVHVCPDDNSKVRYTTSAAKGKSDAHVTISVGRYLEKYYGKGTDKAMDNETIKDWVNKHKEKCEEGEVFFASTPDECEDVYRNGPSSCMDGAHTSSFMDYTGGIFPARVYGGPDTVLAYTKRNGKYNSRCVCNISVNPPRYGRVYGDVMLATRLTELGFVHDDAVLLDVRLLKIPVGDNSAVFRDKSYKPGEVFVMPYLDGNAARIHVNGDYIKVNANTDFPEGRSTAAIIRLQDTSGWVECTECHSLSNPDEMYHVHGGGHVCTTCLSRSFRYAKVSAAGTSGYVRKSDAVVLLGEYHWSGLTPEEYGYVALYDGSYANAVNAVVALDGNVISDIDSPDYVKLGDVWVAIAGITVNFVTAGPHYAKKLYHPDHVPDGVTNPMTLLDLAREVAGRPVSYYDSMSSIQISVFRGILRTHLKQYVVDRCNSLVNEYVQHAEAVAA